MPEGAVWEAFRTTSNADNLLLCERSINILKGGYLNGNGFIGQRRLDEWLAMVRLGNREGAENPFTAFNLVSLHAVEVSDLAQVLITRTGSRHDGVHANPTVRATIHRRRRPVARPRLYDW